MEDILSSVINDDSNKESVKSALSGFLNWRGDDYYERSDSFITDIDEEGFVIICYDKNKEIVCEIHSSYESMEHILQNLNLKTIKNTVLKTVAEDFIDKVCLKLGMTDELDTFCHSLYVSTDFVIVSVDYDDQLETVKRVIEEEYQDNDDYSFSIINNEYGTDGVIIKYK